jgi:hypothetical protein
MLARMGALSDQQQENHFEAFVGRWLAPIVAVFLRAVGGDPALAFDLATETLAAARLRCEFSPDDDAAVERVLRLGANVLDETVQRKRVPATERRRQQRAAHRLSTAEQREIVALAEEHIELPVTARDVAEALARMAPPPHVIAQLRCSELVQAEPLQAPEAVAHHKPHRVGDQDGA